MTTNKDNVLELVDFLSAGKADQTECGALFDEEILALGHDPRAWLSTMATIPSGTQAAADDPLRIQPPVGFNIAQIYALFVANRQLSSASLVELEGRSKQWRERTGSPTVYTTEREDDRTFRIFPALDRVYDVNDIGAPVILYTEHRTNSLPDILHLPLALLTLAREYERESNHRDTGFADISRALAMHILSLVY